MVRVVRELKRGIRNFIDGLKVLKVNFLNLMRRNGGRVFVCFQLNIF